MEIGISNTCYWEYLGFTKVDQATLFWTVHKSQFLSTGPDSPVQKRSLCGLLRSSWSTFAYTKNSRWRVFEWKFAVNELNFVHVRILTENIIILSCNVLHFHRHFSCISFIRILIISEKKLAKFYQLTVSYKVSSSFWTLPGFPKNGLNCAK